MLWNKSLYHERNEGERADTIKVFLDMKLGEPKAGDRMAPPNVIGDNTSGHRTRGLKIIGDKTYGLSILGERT